MIESHLEKGVAILTRQSEMPLVLVIVQMVGQPRAENIENLYNNAERYLMLVNRI